MLIVKCLIFLTFFISNLHVYTSKYSSNFKQRIAGGFEVNENDFPFFAQIVASYFHRMRIICGGSIIHKHVVLSAGHCILEQSSVYHIFVGSTKAMEGHSYETTDFVLHPNYSQSTLNNDIALFFPKKPIIFGVSVQMVSLPDEDEGYLFSDLSGQIGLVCGFGYMTPSDRQGSSEETSDKLRALHVPIISKNKCAQLLAGLEVLNDNDICAGGKHGQDVCRGDSGGPLIVDNRQVAIVSRGPGCGLDNIPSVYVQVHNYIKWIKKHIDILNRNKSQLIRP